MHTTRALPPSHTRAALIFFGWQVIHIHSPFFVDGVDPSLVQVNEEDHVVSKATHAVHGGHADNERKQIVDEGVQRPINHEFPRKVGHALKLVVHE